MKGFPIGSLCVLVKSHPRNAGAIVEIVGPPIYSAANLVDGSIGPTGWRQPVDPVTPIVTSGKGSFVSPLIANMRLLSDPDKAPVEEKERVV